MTEPINWHTPMFGRDAEMAQLQKALEQARGGKGSTIFVAGEAGIGKTRLVDEFLASLDDCLILRGWCLPESMEPLVPIREALASGGLEESFTGIVPPKMTACFLVDRSGMLVTKAEKKEFAMDADIFMGMLTAVSTFVQDFFGRDQAGSGGAGLNTLGYQDYRILIEPSEQGFSLISIIEGQENEKFLFDAHDLLEDILNHHQTLLETWSGEEASVAPIKDRLESFVASDKFIGRELVTDDPRLRQENLFDNIKLGMQRVAQQGPTILFLDDLQWADPSSLACINYLARTTRGYPVLILGTYRPEDVSMKSDGTEHPLQVVLSRMEGEDLLTIIEVPRLGQEPIRELIQAVIGKIAEIDSLVTRIHTETEGNSLFAKEILKLLIEDRVLVADHGWRLDQDLDEVHLSLKMIGIIERRLERLTDADREVLDCAAIIGSVFARQTLFCTLEDDPGLIGSTLGRIETLHTLIHAFPDHYRFDHAKIREVLYDSLALDLREDYHRSIGECLLREHEEDPFQICFELAYHLDLAGDSRAYGFALRAAENAMAEFGTDEAKRQFKIALKHCSEPHEMAGISEGLGDIAELEADLDTALDLFEMAFAETDEPNDRSRLLRKQAAILRTKGDLQKSIEYAQQAASLVAVDSDDFVRARFAEAAGHWRAGAFEETKAILEPLLSQDLMEETRASGLHTFGSVLVQKGDYGSAQGYLQEAIDIRTRLGDRRGIAGSLNNIAILHLFRGDLDQALEINEKCLAIREEIGEKQGIGSILGNIGIIHAIKGSLELALSYNARSLVIIQEIGNRQGIGSILGNIGLIHHDLGNLEKALDYQQRSLEICEETGGKWGICQAYLGLAETLFDQGEIKTASDFVPRCLELAGEIGLPEEEGRALVLRGLIAASQGEPYSDDLRDGLAKHEAGSYEKAGALYRIAQVLIEESPQEARTHLAEARVIFEKIGNRHKLNKIEKLEWQLEAREDE